MRKKHGLEPGRTYDPDLGGRLRRRADRALYRPRSCRLEHPAQVVAICGRNAELKAGLDAARGRPATAPGSRSSPSATRPRWTSTWRPPTCWSASPAGLTTSEALASGLVFVVVNPIPGQEERNSDHLLEEGAAIRCNNLPVLAYKIDRLLDDPARLARMREAVARLARPHAARDVVRISLAVAERAARARPPSGRGPEHRGSLERWSVGAVEAAEKTATSPRTHRSRRSPGRGAGSARYWVRQATRGPLR